MKYIDKKYNTNLITTKGESYKLISILLFIFIGSIIGSIFISHTSFFDINTLYNFTNTYLSNNKINITFFEIFFKNIRFFIIIWFLGFISYGQFFIMLLSLLKGISLGASSSLFIIMYGNLGIKYIFDLYLFEATISIFIHTYISLKAIYYIKSQNNNLLNYSKSMFICAFIILIICIVRY